MNEDSPLFLEAGWVVPIEGAPFRDGAVLVREGSIEAVGPAAELRARHGLDGGDTAIERLSFPDCVLLPGLVNVHSHLEYSAFHDFSPCCGFGEWMLRLLRARRRLVPEDYAVSARWGAQLCVRSGITCIADTAFEGWTTVRAAGEAGLRARVYLEVIGLDEEAAPAAMAGVAARLEELTGEAGPLLEVGLCPHAPYTVSPRLYREVARYARRRGLAVATHVAESPAEVELLERGTGGIALAYKAAQLWQGRLWRAPGLRPAAYLSTTGILGPATLAVHCVHVDEEDIATLAETETAVAHCPRSNARLQCGIAPVAELLRAGVRVGLGTDSLASNDNLDMFDEMRAALASSRARSGARPLTEGEVLRMATLGGATALGLHDRIGSLERGKRGDLVMIRLPAAATVSDGRELERRLVLQAGAAQVRLTVIDGRIAFAASDGTAPEEMDKALAHVRRKLDLPRLRLTLS